MICFLALAAAEPGFGATLDSKGKDFWLTFLQNNSTPELTLFIAGNVATSGKVEIPGLRDATTQQPFSATFTVTPGAVTPVILPSGAELRASDTVEQKGIHVTAAAEVSVYGLSRVSFTTDAYLALPTDILGKEYLNLGFGNAGSELGLVATENATTVTITPSVTTGSRMAGIAYTMAMNRGDTYLLQNRGSAPTDLSGSLITSTKPIAVFGGHTCANVPDTSTSFCDHIVEQLTPTVAWGKNFVTAPLATRIGGDTFRFVASVNATQIRVNGVLVTTLDRGKFFQTNIQDPAQITATNPILVAQYSNGTSFDGVTSDPFMALIPPFEQFLADYTVTTPASGFTFNFINVVVADAGVGVVQFDGQAILASKFTKIGTSGFSAAQLAVPLGSHRLQGVVPFGVTVYGFSTADSYGYPGGLSLAPVSTVSNLTLTPRTGSKPAGTPYALTAKITDQRDAPIEGIRVDFVVSGANTAAGFAFTNAQGRAQFSYTSTVLGVDTITATSGSLTAVAQQTVSRGASRTFRSLIADAQNHQGIASFVLSGDGNFSGTLKLAGLGRFTVRGVFGTDGKASVVVARLGVVDLESTASGVIRLTLKTTAGERFYDATPVRSPFSAGVPTTSAGSFTALLPPDPAHLSDPAVPHSSGYAVVVVDKLGNLRAAGVMGDGARFGTGSGLQADGTAPIFAGLYASHTGRLQGLLTFGETTDPDSDGGGVLAWIKPNTPGDSLYPGGFSANTTALLSRYTKPLRPTGVLQLGAGREVTVNFSEGNLTAAIQGVATIRDVGESTVARPLRSLTVLKSSGLFNGYFVGADLRSKRFRGVVIQKQNRGAGFFLGTDRAGAVALTPGP